MNTWRRRFFFLNQNKRRRSWRLETKAAAEIKGTEMMSTGTKTKKEFILSALMQPSNVLRVLCIGRNLE